MEPISSYLEDLIEDQVTEYLVPDKVLLKYAMAMDIVRPSCSRSCCFTRAYGHYAVGTGSVVQQCMGSLREELDEAFVGYKRSQEEREAGAERLAWHRVGVSLKYVFIVCSSIMFGVWAFASEIMCV